MSDTPKPKRRWFQFHLSTAVGAMVVASLFLWANTANKNIIIGTANRVGQPKVIVQLNGWPFFICGHLASPTDFAQSGTTGDESSWTPDYSQRTLFEGAARHGLAILLNVLIALSALICVTGICEFVIRRRETRKP